MRVTVRYFATFRRVAGVDKEEVEVSEGTTVGSLVSTLGNLHAELIDLRDIVNVSVNLAHAGPDHVLRDGDEVGIFPPVSGG
jgi:molybdopterin synthase sulfur carrier subunit